jgi:uncharacterized protein YfiM (DUF2279 family)
MRQAAAAAALGSLRAEKEAAEKNFEDCVRAAADTAAAAAAQHQQVQASREDRWRLRFHPSLTCSGPMYSDAKVANRDIS